MRKLILAATAVAALGVATPASAQLGDIIQREILKQGIRNVLGGSGLGANSGRLELLDDRIHQAFQRGDISREEAQRLFDEFEQLRRLNREYRQGGFSREERFEIERRIDQLERRIEDARMNRNGRFDDGRFGRNGQSDRSDSGRNGCPPGLAKRNNGCLPPGQARRSDRDFDGRDRFPGTSQDRFQDNDRFVYQRQADGRVLQIDRRTGQVVRVISPRR